jgi:hypothetical protein
MWNSFKRLNPARWHRHEPEAQPAATEYAVAK